MPQQSIDDWGVGIIVLFFFLIDFSHQSIC